MRDEIRRDPDEPTIRQILVAVDASPAGLAALEGAVRFASVFDAELTVLYVEDEDLLNLPRFSFIRELDPLSGELRRLEPDEMERKIRIEAARIRRRLERAVLETQIQWSFRVSRGRVISELLRAAEAVDAVSLGARRHSLARGPGSTARAILDRSDRPVIMLWTRKRVGNRVCVAYDGSRRGRRGLVMGARLAQAADAGIALMLYGPSEEHGDLEGEAVSFLRSVGIDEGAVEVLPPADGSKMARTLKEMGCNLLVMPRDVIERHEAIKECVREGMDCPLLILN